MFYQFPHISKIEHVLPAIEGVDGFIVAEREDFDIIQYVYVSPEVFPPVTDLYSAIRRECRGIAFDKQGNIISRPLHKFFNLNERAETQENLINLRLMHTVLDKIDGSMIRPLLVKNHWRLGTKMGISDVALQAEKWIKDKKEYYRLFDYAWYAQVTPIFEWVSPENRIVLNYPRDNLILTHLRHMTTGNYYLPDQVREVATSIGISSVDDYSRGITSIDKLSKEIHSSKDDEGRVIMFYNGHMLKVKTEWYTIRHKSKDKLTREKDILQAILDENIDDIKSFLTESDREQLDNFISLFWSAINEKSLEINKIFSEIRPKISSKKDFALNVSQNLPQFLPHIFYKVWESTIGIESYNAIRKVLLDVIRKNITTQTKINENRYLWNNLKWEYNFDADS